MINLKKKLASSKMSMTQVLNPFVIDADGTEILIPVHDNFIKELDREENKIFLDLPDGLMDIFK